MWIWMAMLACASKKTQLESFELAWQTVNESYPYEDFQGTDWQAVHDELLPQAKKASTAEEIRPVISDMVGRLGVSHFGVIPKEEYDNDAGTEASSAASADQAELGWTGVEMRWVEDSLIVTQVAPLAEESGVRVGHEVQKIGERMVSEVAKRNADSEDSLAFNVGIYALRKMMGPVGETVQLTVLPPEGEPSVATLPFVLGNAEVAHLGHLPPQLVRFEHQKLDHNIHVIAFNTFMMPIRHPMTTAFQAIAEEKPAGLIIDLRGNLGGLGALGAGLAGHLISERNLNIGQQITRDGSFYFQVNPRSASHRYDGPVAVLVDELSVSTSEIAAGGLQELNRARVIGASTPGKALPSLIIRLPNGDGFQYVIADLKKPSGGSYEGDGVTPDETVILTKQALQAGEDPMLAAAQRWLQSQAPPSENDSTSTEQEKQ